MSMNKNLQSFYADILSKKLTPALKPFIKSTKDQPANPLLIKVDEEYENSDFKIMLFGQETNSWNIEFCNGLYHPNLSIILERYEIFFLGNGSYNYGKGNKPCSKIVKGFWGGVNEFFRIFRGTDYPFRQFVFDNDKRVSFIWNNVVKLGKQNKKGRPNFYPDIKEINKEIIKHEIEVLNPNVLLLFSGPFYDDVVKYIFDIDGFFEDCCGARRSSLGFVA